MGQDKLGDGASVARQQLAVGPTGHAMLSSLNRFLGRDALLTRGRGPADPDQAGDLSDLESRVAMQQEMAEQSSRIVILAAMLPEGKRRLQQAALLGRQSLLDNLRLRKPLCKSTVRGAHKEILPDIVSRRIIACSDQKLTVRA